MAEIQDIRGRIDRIDEELVRLFSERMRIVADVAEAKRESGKPVYDPARERSVLNRATLLSGETFAPYTRDLYRLIFELSRSYQNALLSPPSPLPEQLRATIAQCADRKLPNRATVACQGVEGAYQTMACLKLFEYPDIRYHSTFDDVFGAVERGECDYGVLPIENSTAGSVVQVYDLMQQHAFSIVRAAKVRIDHRLLRRSGAKGPIREVVSHEQALRQCSRFFSDHPSIRQTAMANTAVAAQFVADSGRDDLAAIASGNCAELYGLTVEATDVSNTPSNYTRFITISRRPEIYPGANRISFTCALPHEAGSLNRILTRLAIAGINLCKLESRPRPGLEGEYRFFFDLEADVREPLVQKVLGEMQHSTEAFSMLGAYAEF